MSYKKLWRNVICLILFPSYFLDFKICLRFLNVTNEHLYWFVILVMLSKAPKRDIVFKFLKHLTSANDVHGAYLKYWRWLLLSIPKYFNDWSKCRHVHWLLARKLVFFYFIWTVHFTFYQMANFCIGCVIAKLRCLSFHVLWQLPWMRPILTKTSSQKYFTSVGKKLCRWTEHASPIEAKSLTKVTVHCNKSHTLPVECSHSQLLFYRHPFLFLSWEIGPRLSEVQPSSYPIAVTHQWFP